MAIIDPDLPGARQPVADTSGGVPRPWYAWFTKTAQRLSNAEQAITTLEQSGGSSAVGNVLGLDSVLVQGSIHLGNALVSLVGDVDAPGNTTYYGTDTGGNKGFYTIASAFLGTANNIALTTAGNGVTTIAIDAAYPGQASIVTVGTIATGTWHGTAIDQAYGGTGLTSYTAGDVLVADATGTLVRLPIGAATNVLTSQGPGLPPIWGTGGGGGGVTSWNTRTGAVVPQTGDYTFSQIGGSLADTQLPGTRHTATVNSPSGAVTTGTVAMASAGRLFRLASNAPLRVRLYSTVAHQVADQSRPVSVYPPPGSGLLFEGITSVGLPSFDTGPVPDFFNAETVITSAIAYCLEPGTAVSTTATFTYAVISP